MQNMANLIHWLPRLIRHFSKIPLVFQLTCSKHFLGPAIPPQLGQALGLTNFQTETLGYNITRQAAPKAWSVRAVEIYYPP